MLAWPAIIPSSSVFLSMKFAIQALGLGSLMGLLERVQNILDKRWPWKRVA
jgi:hypothetical protein